MRAGHGLVWRLCLFETFLAELNRELIFRVWVECPMAAPARAVVQVR